MVLGSSPVAVTFLINAKGGFISIVNFPGHSVYPLVKAVNLNRKIWYWNFQRL